MHEAFSVIHLLITQLSGEKAPSRSVIKVIAPVKRVLVGQTNGNGNRKVDVGEASLS
jgi:hypothetical protein